jgi:hypothetical protein
VPGSTKKKQPSRNNSFQFVTSPFAGMSEEELNELLVLLGQNSFAKFQETLSEFQTSLEEVSPTLLLSSFAFYGLTHDGISPEGERPIQITQHHVELLQAFLLMKDQDVYSFHPIVGDTFPKFLDYLSTLSILFHIKRYGDFTKTTSQSDRQKLSIQEYMRTHTQVVRNWGYPQQIQRTTINLFRPLDDAIETILRVRIEHLVNMCFNLVELIEERINKHTKKLQSILSIKKIPRLVEAYDETFLGKENNDGFSAVIKERKLSLQEVQGLLLAHSDLFLPNIFELKISDFLALYPAPVEQDDLAWILDQWSLAFGELADANSEYFFMGNPVWKKPLIKLGDSAFFCPVVGLLVSFCVELMEGLIRDQEQLLQRYEKRRAEFLEDELSRLFSENFPGSKVFRGSQWIDPDEPSKTYENDLLVLFDTTAFVVEAKSGRFRPSSRRGAPSSLQEDIEKLITDATLQANRFIKFLKSHPMHTFSTQHGETNEVNVSHIKHFRPLGVTLDFLGAMGAHIPSLQSANLVSNETAFIPSMALSDIENIFEILTDTAQKLHYIRWRTQLEQQTNFAADEIDLLALYVSDRFSEAQALGQKNSLYIYGESEIFNPYFLRHYHRQFVSKPERRFTKWWRDILQRVEARSVFGWTELATHLLEVPYFQQKRIEKPFKKSGGKLRRQTKDNFTYAVLSSQTTSIILLGYRLMSSEERNMVAGQVAEETMIANETLQAVVIGVDVDRIKQDYPYSFLAIFLPHSHEA